MPRNSSDNPEFDLPKIKTTKVVYPQVYSYTLPDLHANNGSQKIGYTERRDVDARIREQTHTAAVQLRSEKLWSAPAFFSNSQEDFNDKTFHKFLIKSNVENKTDLGTEWFYFNGTPEKSKQLFNTFRAQGFTALQNSNNKIPYTLRTEQQQAVEQAEIYFESHEKGEFLWNAKPRFGKTLASYDLAKRLGASKVLIVTNRPAIANSWFDDFNMFIDGYYFISETTSLVNRPTLTREQYTATGSDMPQITFLSLQDLKGSKYFGGNHDKLRWIADLEWDLLVIDEAHEGIDTDRTDAAFDIINRKRTLHLSGTPFKALANNKFPTEAIFNWTYLDEQKIKQAELEEGEIGDHTDLPNLKLYTYRISQMIADEVNEGIEIDNETRDFAFDLNEFFATSNQKFVHESDVKQFLNNLTSSKKYPFSSPELRDQLKHTFWFVGNRVDSVKALEQLLKQDEVFKEYKVVVAAGDGRSFEEEEADFKGNEKSFDKVKKAIKEHDKTITLSCGQLTTGVTIKEWSAVLMLSDIKTPAQYMQAAFRAQNPYRIYENDELKVKESAYLFDFAPTRVLEIYDQFANGLNGKAANGEITESERKKNIGELLNYFPVISEDIEGRMVELDAEKVLTFPNALAAVEIVKARFMTNLLFNDNIKGVFQFPKEVEDILDKMPVEKNKRIEVAKKELDLDDARIVEQSKQTKINENTGVILGEKIFRSNIERVVDNVLNVETPNETLESLPSKIADLAEPVIAKYKEIYKATSAEIDEIKKDTEEKIKFAIAEYESSELKDATALKENLAKIIEHDFVEEKVEQKETVVVENVQKTKEDEVRDRLRSFTRTIPMFLMANSSNETITIDNFDLQISDEDFVDLTNITKEEFHKLRDGFYYEADGERKTFSGVFDRYKFNASIAEFVLEKQKRADYFKREDDIFELIPNQKNNQIFTPKLVVQTMINDLEKEQPELFIRTDSTFIDLYMKSGLYITEIVKKLFTNTRSQYSSDVECLKHILENQVYGLAPTGILQAITHSLIFGFDESHTISRKNYAQVDFISYVKGESSITAQQKLNKIFNGGNEMKFDAIVGNPPYQENISSSTDNAALGKQLFPYFIETAILLKPKYLSMITPSRWFTGDAQDKSFLKLREFIMQNNHISNIYNYLDSKDIFRDVNISGGVNYFLYKNGYSGDVLFKEISEGKENVFLRPLFEPGLDIILPMNSMVSILRKVTVVRFKSMSDIVTGRNPFGVPATESELNRITTDINVHGHDTKIMCAYEVIKYIKDDQIKRNKVLAKHWKVFTSKMNGGAGTLLDSKRVAILGKTFVTGPGCVCSNALVSIGDFELKSEADNLNKYMNTKFFRFMLGVMKSSQVLTRNVYKYVPQQEFTSKSDIDWSKSISEIDKKLYEKYNLEQAEIDLIESRVKEMA